MDFLFRTSKGNKSFFWNLEKKNHFHSKEQLGGAMQDKHWSIKLKCFLLLWPHSSIREYIQHTLNVGTFKEQGLASIRCLPVTELGKHTSTSASPISQNVLYTILFFLTFPIFSRNKLGWLKCCDNCPQPSSAKQGEL